MLPRAPETIDPPLPPTRLWLKHIFTFNTLFNRSLPRWLLIFLFLTPLRLNSCSSDSKTNLPKYTTLHLTPPTLLETLASSLENILLSLTKLNLSPKPVTITLVNFIVHSKLDYCNSLYYRWRGGTMGRVLDLRSNPGPGFKYYSVQKLRNNLGQVIHTYVPLSPSSITHSSGAMRKYLSSEFLFCVIPTIWPTTLSSWFFCKIPLSGHIDVTDHFPFLA